MTALLKPCGAKRDAVSIYLLLATRVLLLCVCPLFPPTFISSVMEDCNWIKSDSVRRGTCCGCTASLRQDWVDFCKHSLRCELLSAARSKLWGGFDKQPGTPVGFTSGRCSCKQLPPLSLWPRRILLPTPGCLSLGSCQNFILDFDTSSYFRARSNKCLICICTAPLGWNAWSFNNAFALPVDAGHHTQCVFLPLLLHRSLCLSSLSCTAKLPLFTYILKVTLQRNCFLKIMRNEPSQKLENETLFLLWCPREISSAVNWKGCSCCLCDHSALTPRSDCRWILDMLSRGLKVLLHMRKTGWGGQETFFFPCLPWFLPTQKMWAHP